MVDIDERVVSMKFDSNDFEQKSKSTLSILDKLKNALTFKSAADDSMENLNAINNNIEKMASKAYTIVDRMVDKIRDNIANKLVNFLQENTVGQLQAGWSKYADMTTSVATLKSQGYAMERITDQLERLNYFTDETSYNFTSMVSEIGKFTASGQSLEDATTAMMGIAEWAALSGKNAGEASRAMYQLSQALGAGEMRLQDYKSIQNLNMDTIEFRKNAIEAALAVGTLKDNLDGTYTSLINNKVTFSIQNFAESLTKGKWFNSNVMMSVYSKYSEAVDEIRDIVEEGSYITAEGNLEKINTTAEAIRLVKDNNEKLLRDFEKANKKLDSDSVSKLLSKWKKVDKVTDEAVANYMTINDVEEDVARNELQKNYAEYVKEYTEVFGQSEAAAEEALDKWHSYVSEFGVKAFLSAQEAKTFGEAIESAKDAASTVWTTIYTNVFGNYDEAKQLWTDLANALYDIFVMRLWDLNDVFEYWRSGGASALENSIDEYTKELKILRGRKTLTDDEIEKVQFLEEELDRLDKELNKVFVNGKQTTRDVVDQQIKKYEAELAEMLEKGNQNISAAESQRISELKAQIDQLNAALDETVFVDGRRRMMQGIYAFGAGLKSLIENFREGWDEVTEDNIGGKRLLSFSEKLRVDGFRFYNMMIALGETDFFENIAQGIKNILSPFTGAIQVIGSAIGQFLPDSMTFQEALVDIARRFKEFTDKIRPSEETLKRFARVLRGVISFFRLIGKAALGIWNSILRPIFEALFWDSNSVFNIILEIVAQIGDAFFSWEKGIDEMEAMATVGTVLKEIFQAILFVISNIVKGILTLLMPVIRVVSGTVRNIITKIRNLVGNGEGGLVAGIAEGFKNIATRIKQAWGEGETLADVFNRFKTGSGIGNFLEMLGEMLDNIVTRVGRVIMAFLGFDEVATNGKVGSAIKSLKDVFYEVGKVIAWLYTNVIRPTLLLLFQGVAACLRDIGEAFKSGDILHILDVIGSSIKTIGSLEIVKLIMTITKLLGSGGLLKVIRNTAKTIKTIGKYFAAKIFHEHTKAILSLSIGIGILTVSLIALANLPEAKFEKVAKMALVIAGAFTVLMTTMALLTRNSGAENFWDYLKASPMEQAAKMFWALTVAILTTIFAIKLLKLSFSNLWETDAEGNKTLNVGALVETLIGTLTPIVAVLTVLGIIVKIIKKANIVGTLGGIAAVLASVAIGILALALAIKSITGTFQSADNAGQVWAAFAMVIILFSVLTTAAVVASKFIALNGTIRSGIALAIGLVSVVAVMALMVMPVLEEMVQQSSKFPEYAAAIALFSAMMLSIAGSLALMTANTKNSIAVIFAGYSFKVIAGVLLNVIVPVLQSMQSMDIGTAMASAVIIAGLALALGKAIQWIFTGFANIIKYIAKIKASQWLSIILGIGGVIAGIILLTRIFEDNGQGLKVGTIVAITVSIITIILALGVFARMMSKAALADSSLLGSIVKLFNAMTIFLGVIVGSIIGFVVVVKLLFKNDWGDALTIMASLVIAVLITLSVSLYALSKAIESIGRSLRAARSAGVDNIVHLITNYFKVVLALMGVLIVGSIALKIGFEGKLGYIGPLIAMVVSTLVLVGGLLTGLGIFLTKVENFRYDETTFSLLKIAFIGLIATMVSIIAGSIVLYKVFNNGVVDYLPAMASVVFTVLAAIGGLLLVLGHFITEVGNADTLSNNRLAVISITMLSLIIMIGEISLMLIPALAKIQNVPWENIAIALGGVAVVIGIMSLLALKLAKISSIENVPTILAGMAATAGQLWVLSKVLPEIFDAFNKFKGADAMDIVLALAAIIVPFYAFTEIIKWFALTGLGGAFLVTAGEIALGILVIAAALGVLAHTGTLFKNMLGIGENLMSGEAAGVRKGGKSFEKALADEQKKGQEIVQDENGIKSPSKVYKKYGKFIDQGLAQGIAKNKNIVTTAMSGLALVTNETFCEELGIASPSKVFYENGRFVVRGFINGVNDESNKNKTAGADMAEGFMDGLNVDKIKEEIGSIWDFGSLEEDAAKAGNTAGEGFFESLMNKLLGKDADELTEEEKKQYNKLMADRDKLVDEEMAKWDEKHENDTKDTAYATARAAEIKRLQEKYTNEELKALQDRVIAQTNKSASSGGGLSAIGDMVSGFFTNGISGAFDNPELQGKIDAGLATVGGFFTSFFSGDGQFLTDLKDSFTGKGGIVDEVIEDVKEKIPEEILNLTEDGKIEDASEDLGDKIGSSILRGILGAMGQWATEKSDEFWEWTGLGKDAVPDFLDWITGESKDKERYKSNNELIDNFQKYINKTYDNASDYSQFGSLLKIAIKDFDDFDLNSANGARLQRIWEEYKSLIDSGANVSRIELDQGLLTWLANDISGFSLISDLYGVDVSRTISMNAVGNFGADDAIEDFKDMFMKSYRVWLGVGVEEDTLNNLTDKDFINIIREGLSRGVIVKDKNGNYILNGTDTEQQAFGDWIEDGVKTGNLTYDELTLLNESVRNDLLKGKEFKDGKQFTDQELIAIKAEASKLGLFNFIDGSLDVTTGDKQMLAILTSYVMEIATNGIPVFDKDAKTQSEITYANAQNAKSLDYLKQLEQSANAGSESAKAELYALTGGKSVDAFLKDIESDYNKLVSFMKTTEYNTMNAEKQQFYKDKRDFYLDYWLRSDTWRVKVAEGETKDTKTDSNASTKTNKDQYKLVDDEYSANYELGQAAADGKADGTIDEHDKREKEVNEKTTLKDQDNVYKLDKDGSPSRVYYEFGKWRVMGMQNGFMDTFEQFSKVSLNAIQGLNKDSELALNAMVNSLDQDVQPTITPVFDDSSLGLSALNRSFEGLTPMMQATVDSFQDDTPNYNGPLSLLANQVNGLTTVVNSFMQMVADGDIITVNVNAEADPNNIYNYVIDANRQRFRQTGKNPLAY